MHAQHLAVNERGQRQKVEHLASGFPNRGVAVLLLAFFVEPIHLRDLAGLVVAADQSNTFRVSRKILGLFRRSEKSLTLLSGRGVASGFPEKSIPDPQSHP